MSAWEEMTKDILTDIAKIVAADPTSRYIVAVVQWQGKFRPGFVPN